MTCHSEDGKVLYPWALDSAKDIWDRFGAQQLGFRSFTYGKSNSKGKAAMRMTMILRENCHWLGGSRYTDVDVLFEEFLGQLTVSLAHIADKGIDRINAQVGGSMNAKLTFWRYLQPDLRAMKTLSDERLGITDQDNIQDMQRRKAKAEIIRDFGAEWKDYARRAAYLSGSDRFSNQKLNAALEIARQAMGQALDDLQFESKD